MKRILLMVFRNIFLVPFMWIKLCYYASHVDKYPEEKRFAMLKFITSVQTKEEMLRLKSMGKKIYQRKTDLFSTPTIRDFMMYWRWQRRVQGRFLWSQKKKWLISSF